MATESGPDCIKQQVRLREKVRRLTGTGNSIQYRRLGIEKIANGRASCGNVQTRPAWTDVFSVVVYLNLWCELSIHRLQCQNGTPVERKKRF